MREFSEDFVTYHVATATKGAGARGRGRRLRRSRPSPAESRFTLYGDWKSKIGYYSALSTAVAREQGPAVERTQVTHYGGTAIKSSLQIQKGH
ncbi:hypothetical protein EVAR_23026_1 [Eumeta japonica]|uniref:Uncharacterized protein n=1 Tax=Eumeta variegata TaxID=151549 RepID=A0A4C1UQ23_EUMVA|nr:hypothetical protein EVAR_23026_1 [Eumeta japonica]